MAIEFNGVTIPHKYLFIAEYSDGEQYEQGFEDKSLQEEDKNAFFDILYRPIKPIETLVRFSLIDSDTKSFKRHVYTVDLRDGHFEVDGVAFRLHEEDFLKDFRLIFFRRHFHHTVIGGEQKGQESHEVQCHLGWQTSVKGKNYQKTINFD